MSIYIFHIFFLSLQAFSSVIESHSSRQISILFQQPHCQLQFSQSVDILFFSICSLEGYGHFTAWRWCQHCRTHWKCAYSLGTLQLCPHWNAKSLLPRAPEIFHWQYHSLVLKSPLRCREWRTDHQYCSIQNSTRNCFKFRLSQYYNVQIFQIPLRKSNLKRVKGEWPEPAQMKGSKTHLRNFLIIFELLCHFLLLFQEWTLSFFSTPLCSSKVSPPCSKSSPANGSFRI